MTADMAQRAVNLTDRAVVALANAIVRRAAMDLWNVADTPRRKPKRIKVQIRSPFGENIYRQETDEEYMIRMEDLERIRQGRMEDLEQWFRGSYALMLAGVTGEGVVVLDGDPDRVIKVIEAKRRKGLGLFATEGCHVYYRTESKRLRS